MKIHQNIKRLREQRGMSQEALALKTGYKDRSSIAKIESGHVDLSQSKIAIFASVLGVTPAQLMGWEDSPALTKPAAAPTAERDIDPIYDALNIAGRQALCAYGRFLGSQTEYRAPEEPSAAPSRIIPLLGASFAAGTPETPGDLFIQDYATTDPHAEFAIRVNGNSMEPYLADGSIALGVKRAPRDGEVGAFWLDGGFLIKQVCQDHIGNTYLFSLNRDRADADETIWHDSDRDLRLIGTILMSQRLPLP